MSLNKGPNKDIIQQAATRGVLYPSYIVTGELPSTANKPSKTQYSNYISPLGSLSGINTKEVRKSQNQNGPNQLRANQTIPHYEIIDEDDDLISDAHSVLKECSTRAVQHITNAVQQVHETGTASNGM